MSEPQQRGHEEWCECDECEFLRLGHCVQQLRSQLARANATIEALRKVVATARAMYPHARSAALNDALAELDRTAEPPAPAEAEPKGEA